MTLNFLTLDDIRVAGKTVLVRADLNVPMSGGKVTDSTRIVRLVGTLEHLIAAKAKVVILSHFGRPKGEFVPSMSLASLVDPLSEALGGREVKFGVDCIGAAAKKAVTALKAEDVLLLENLRFHPEEEKGDANFARELAELGDIYINDAFSASHRAHASIAGIPKHLPAAAGRLMQEELQMLGGIFSGTKTPIAGVIGGAKVSTKLELLLNLSSTMHKLIIGGAMANTFLLAQGHKLGKSLVEPSLVDTAARILKQAEKKGCEILLPVDAVVARTLEERASCKILPITKIPAGGMILDVGPETITHFSNALKGCKTVVWNGPIGAFEVSPFDASTVMLARQVAALTTAKKLHSIAGGGDTLAALSHAGLADSFSYISTAGGAFLEWLEGKTLPGVAALLQSTPPRKRRA
ncbi:MAG: phosphoglycerate kinase [Alphaproteobacteria bacterium]